MSLDRKDQKENIAPRKSKKNLIIFIILLVICSVAGFFLFEKSPEQKIEVVEVNAFEDGLDLNDNVEDSVTIKDSLASNDTLKIDLKNNFKPSIKNRKRTVTKDQLDNNPKYWMVVKQSNDTTFYTLKNKKTGTKLSNKYYSKEIAEKELIKFKKIISR